MGMSKWWHSARVVGLWLALRETMMDGKMYAIRLHALGDPGTLAFEQIETPLAAVPKDDGPGVHRHPFRRSNRTVSTWSSSPSARTAAGYEPPSSRHSRSQKPATHSRKQRTETITARSS